MAETEQVTQKVIRCRRFVAEAPQVNPRYAGNTPKEELLLEHVREFEEQFVQVYGNRFLFLCPPNEFGVPKFLPTTLRATHLAFKELYEYRSCAHFLSDFINYEELNPPNKYPDCDPGTLLGAEMAGRGLLRHVHHALLPSPRGGVRRLLRERLRAPVHHHPERGAVHLPPLGGGCDGIPEEEGASGGGGG